MAEQSANDDARAFWRFFEPARVQILVRAREAMARHAEWPQVARGETADAYTERDRRTHQLMVPAFLEGNWEPLWEQIRDDGARLQANGLSFRGCVDMIFAYRDATRDALLAQDGDRAADRRQVFRGLSSFFGRTIAEIGEGYIAAKSRALAAAEQRYRGMFEQSPQPMWRFDRDTLSFVAVNEAAVRHYGFSRDEFLTMTLADIRPREDVAAMHAAIAAGLPGLAPEETWRHRKKDGSLITVEVRGNDFDIDGRRLRLVQVNDITERKRTEEALHRAEEQLRHAQKMDAIGRLAGGVAHDFNNVLTVVQSFSSMLAEDLEPGDPRHEDAVQIRRAAERGAGITRQLLLLSRHGKVAPKPVDLDELIAGMLPMLRRLIGADIPIAAHRGATPEVLIDPGQMEQVLLNLAANARDAMPAGGRLTIETRELVLDAEAAALRTVTPGRYVEVAVTDTGQGMDAATRAKIFEPFFTTKEAGKGTGLGLSIVHGIVTQARGVISVYSEPGHGTTFRIDLPVLEGEAHTEAGSAVEVPRTLPQLTVLIVDDQEHVRAAATRVLTAAGCRVLEAASAEAARRVVVHHEEPIDVALLDIVLPDGRGESLIGQLRDLRPSLRFVQMSGYPAGALSHTGAPPKDLLSKPFTPTELRAAIARVAGAESPAVTAAGEAGAGKPQRRALVADDDNDFRRSMVKLLRRGGFDVTDVDSGFRAISMLEKESFDVVVSDVQMPDGGGLDLLRAVRRIDLDVPVVLVTGDPSLAAAATAVEYGAFRYLTKPVDAVSFTNTVQHAARAHALARLRREAFHVGGRTAGAVDRAGLEVRFDSAIASMWMAFQPIVHARNLEPFGVEALMRTDEPSMPHPGAVLDAALQLGRLPLLGRRVRALSAEALVPRTDGLVLFVNLHPDDLQDADLIDAAAPLTSIASRVILEVTERAALDRTPALAARIEKLRALGFRLAVDDIGAGYSGLTSFTELTPEIVKIDMSLVRDVHTSALKQRTIAALCSLCREVGTLVVGEGVETPEERECLVGLGCDLLQGYVIGRPDRKLR